MAIRSRYIHPDTMFQTPSGEQFAVVGRQALETALADGAAMLDVAGGTLTIVTLRAPTGVPNEMMTVGAIMEWKDRTDAKAQAETPTAPALFESTEAPPVLPFEHEVADEGSPDGLDYAALPDEDLEDVPAEVR